MKVREAIASIIAAHKAVPLVNAPTDVVEAGEILSERKESMRVFNAGNGQRRAHIYACPIHYKDANGVFRSIDPTVKRKPLLDPRQTHQFEVKSGLYHAHFKTDKPHDYRLEIRESFVEYEALFDESDSLTIDVQTSRVGVKETITLADKTAPTKLSWKVTRSGTGIITPPPVAVDADGKPVPVATSEKDGILTYDVDTTDAVFPVMVDPTTVTTTNDCVLYAINKASYTLARDASVSDGVITSYIVVGQYTADSLYNNYRGFFSFALPSMGSVTATSLFLYGKVDSSTDDFNIYTHTSTYTSPAEVGDYILFDGRQSGIPHTGTILNDAWDTSAFVINWNELIMNAAGRAAVLSKSNNTLKIAIISKEDYDNSAPTTPENVQFESSETAGKEPYLSITYTQFFSGARFINAGNPGMMTF